MKKTIAIAASLVILQIIGYTQPLTGRVTDSARNPLPDVLVTLINLTQDNILRYTVTQADGTYRLIVPATDSGNFRLCVRLFGYHPETVALEPGRTQYDFTLIPDATALPEAIVESNRPQIHSNGDTTTYTAAQFAHAQDRTIGDVMRRMPGIDVDNTGKISYNGKAVSAFYIDGDNLLDDRYNIGTTSIPHQVVDKVQVIENNEPIQVKAARTGGSVTAINITLKDAAQRPIDQFALSAGPPDYVDLTISNLLFQRGYKVLNQIKANNTGVDYANDLTSYDQHATTIRTGDPLPEPLVSLTGLPNPPIDARRYRFNQSGMINTNNLFHLGTDWQLKVKASGLYDRQQADLNNNTAILLGNNSISYSENSRSNIRPEKADLEIGLTTNRKTLYFTDKLQSKLADDQAQGTLLTGGGSSTQYLSTRLSRFANELRFIRRLKDNRLAEFYSYTSTGHFPQTFGISPTVFPPGYGLPDSLSILHQQIDLPTIYTNNYAALTIPAILSQTYKAGVSIETQQLNTKLTGLAPDAETFLPADSATNRLDWNRYRIYTEAQFDYACGNNSQKATLRLPLSWVDTRIRNSPLQQDLTIPHVYFEPELILQLSPGGESALRLRAAFQNDPGTILNFYCGYIEKDYRTLQANNSNYLTSQRQYELSYTLRETARLLFFNAGIIYSQLSTNSTPSIRVTEAFSMINSSIPAVKTANSFEFNTGLSKYLFHWNSTVSLNYQYKYGRTNQVVNGAFLPFDNYSQSLAIRVSTKVAGNFDLSYAGILTHLSAEPPHQSEAASTQSEATSTAAATMLNQKLQLAWLPRPLITFKTSLEDLYNPMTGITNSNSLFIDAAIRYTVQCIHTDVELSVTNLADATNYRIMQLTANSASTTSYPLRPRIVLVKVVFNL